MPERLISDSDVARIDPEALRFWAEAQAKHDRSWRCPRHLVVDRFSYDAGEIGVTTTNQADEVW